MIAEAAQVAAEVAKQGGGASPMTVIGLGFLVVSNIGLWLDRVVQISRARADREQAEAAEAEAKALVAANASKPAVNGNNGAALHEKYVLPHSLMLQDHANEIKAMVGRFDKFEKRNEEDHGKLFGKLDDIKDLIIGKSAGAA